MMKPATWAIACASALLLASQGAVAGDRASAPQSGTYEALLYVQSAAKGCLDIAQNAFIGSMSFGGLSATKNYLRALETGPSTSIDSLQTLNVTSGAGTTHPSGGLVWTGAGIGGSWSVNGSFSATITEISTHAFVLQLKETYTGCSEEDINVSLVRIGVNQ